MKKQASLLENHQYNIELQTIDSRRKFDSMFKGAKKIWGVTYMDSPELILDFFEKRNLSEMELVVGESKDYREKLRGKLDVADRLEHLKREGKLRIYVTDKVVHSKFYFVEREDGKIDFIHGSANLTKNAQEASRQINSVMCYHNIKENPYYAAFLKHYDEHKDFGNLFLDDLREEIDIKTSALPEQAREEERRKIINDWINAKVIDDSKQIYNVKREIAKKITQNPTSSEIIISLDGISDRNTNILKKEFSYTPHSFKDRTLRFSREKYLQAVHRSFGVPVLTVDEDKKEVRCAFEGETVSRTISPEDPAQIDQALKFVEDFFETVDNFGNTNNPTAVKANMYETLLYFLWSPFINCQMSYYYQYGAISDKGLPFLYINGEPNSGKSTFTNFALSLIVGTKTKSISANEITPGDLKKYRYMGASLPLVIDDIESTRLTDFRTTLSTYWKDWNYNDIFPSLIFATNKSKPDDWLKSRIIQVYFDVSFPREPKITKELNEITSQNNPIFCYFSYLYLHDRENRENLTNDILLPSRNVFKKLYKLADRRLPDYFPEQPVQDLYDIGKEKWKYLLEEKRVRIEEKNESINIVFGKDFATYEVTNYLRMLDSRIRAEKGGNTIKIKNPNTFNNWLGIMEKNIFHKLRSSFHNLLGRGS